MKTIKSLPLCNASQELVPIEGIVPLSAPTGDLRVRSWFGVVESLAVNVLLGMSFIDRCIRGIFPSVPKIVRWHSRPVAIISSKISVIAIAAETEEFDVHKIADRSTPTEEHYLCGLARQDTIRA